MHDINFGASRLNAKYWKKYNIYEMNPSTFDDDVMEKLGINPGRYELKLGSTFTGKPSTTAFHTVKYDFKPASVDCSKAAVIDVGQNNTMSVTIPRTDGVDSHTIFKGSQKTHNKECVLIIDEETGEITLERLYSNIQVKQTRGSNKNASGHENSERISPTDGRNNSRTKVVSGKKKEPSHQLPPKKNSTSTSTIPKQKSVPNSTFSSLPLLNDDIVIPSVSRSELKVSSYQASPKPTSSIIQPCSLSETSDSEDDRIVQSSSSSRSSKVSPTLANFTMPIPNALLNEDLQLSSDSSSDSDSS